MSAGGDAPSDRSEVAGLLRKPADYDINSFIRILGQLAASWETRAAVKKGELDVDAMYDETLPDFLIDLIPFKEHPDFVKASDELKSRVLSCGWLAYNEKTIAIETKVISPACMHVIDGAIPGVSHEVCKEVMAQAFVDEAYHTLLLVNACRVTRQRRDLENLRIPQFSLIENMLAAQQACCEFSQKAIIGLVCATVSEISISDYLKLLAGASFIQPLNMITTEIHRRDEAAHSGIFKKIGQMIYYGLSASEREFFVRMLPKPLTWFASLELDVWHSMLRQIGFPNADRIIADCRSQHDYDLTGRDFSALAEMANNLGINTDELSSL
jgi:alpha-N-dichloroacetyl-p-aminophenylserinol N-oxygenase